MHWCCVPETFVQLTSIVVVVIIVICAVAIVVVVAFPVDLASTIVVEKLGPCALVRRAQKI